MKSIAFHNLQHSSLIIRRNIVSGSLSLAKYSTQSKDAKKEKTEEKKKVVPQKSFKSLRKRLSLIEKKETPKQPKTPLEIETENILKDVSPEIKDVFAHPLFSNFTLHPATMKQNSKTQRKISTEIQKKMREEDKKKYPDLEKEAFEKFMAKKPTSTVTKEDVLEAFKTVTDKEKGISYYFMQHEGLMEEAEALDDQGDTENAKRMLPPIGKLGLPHPLYPNITMSIADFETHGIYEHPYLAKLSNTELIPIIYNQLKEQGIPVIELNDSNSSSSSSTVPPEKPNVLPEFLDNQDPYPIDRDLLDRIEDANKGKRVNPAILSKRHPLMFVTQYFPKRPDSNDLSFVTRKARLQIRVSELALPLKIKKRFLKMVGKRYDKETDTLTLVSDRFQKKQENVSYVKRLLQELLHESWKIHKDYVSLSQVKKYLGVDPGEYVFFSTKNSSLRGIDTNKAEPVLKKVIPSASKQKGTLPKMPPPPKPAFPSDYFISESALPESYTEELIQSRENKATKPPKSS